MYIPEEQIAQVLTYEALIPAIRQALIDYSTGKVDQPLRQVLRNTDASGNPYGWFAVMPVIAGEFMAVKTVTFYPGNQRLPTHMATISLLDRATGEPLAIMDGRLITEMRTAAVSAVAIQALAPNVKTLGILGTGVQARAHIEALRLVQPAFRESGSIQIWGRTEQNAIAAAQETGATVVSIEQASACDVVLTVTSSVEPVLRGQWLQAQSLVVAVGASTPQLRELDDEVMAGYLIADSRQSAQNESGDVIHSAAKVQAEIGEILSGSAPTPPPGRTVFKSLGLAIEDLTGAVLVWTSLKDK